MPQKAKKKIPIRRCIGCGEGKPKKELIRVVKNSEGDISLDTSGRMAGRGAYICPSVECLEKAKKRKGLQHSFSMQVPNEIYEALAQQLCEENGGDSG